MKIEGIYVLDKTLPCAGRNYGIAKITAFSGDLPEELQKLVYPEGKQRMTKVPETASEAIANMGSIYIFVNYIGESPETGAQFDIVESIDSFISQFEFADDMKEEFVNYFFGVRGATVGLAMCNFELEDSESDTKVNAVCFYSADEMKYINSEATNPNELFDPNRIASIAADSPIQMVFAEALTKGVDLYNKINYFDKAKDIAKMISSISFINEMGVKGPLNITAVEKLMSNVKDNIYIS